MQTTQIRTEHNVKLPAADVGHLWTFYQNDTMAICTIKAFLAQVEDEQVRSVLDFSLQLAQAHVQKLRAFFSEEQIPIPDGFSEQDDLMKDAPRLFTDDFYLFYIQNLGKLGLEGYTKALSNAGRLDVCEYFTECLNESARLLNKATEILFSKGIFIRAPYIQPAKKVEYVQEQSYLGSLLGSHRPLSAIEISGIHFNLVQNQLGRTLMMGFSQVANHKKVREHFLKGRDISDKQVEVFGSLLSKEFLPSASAWSILPTDSTTPPFSDKLMMFHTTILCGAGIGHYGRSLGVSPRHDLAAVYTRLIAEIGTFANDGAKIMIENGWLEQAPQTTDRDQLAKERG